MISIFVVATLGLLLLATQIGVVMIERAFPIRGRAVEVTGAVLNVVELGPREAAGPPILLLHTGRVPTLRQCGSRSATCWRAIAASS